MEGEFSWLVLVAAFVMVTGLCGIGVARLWRIAGSPGGPAPAGDAADATEGGAGGSGDRSSP
jgi:hypothetical protein